MVRRAVAYMSRRERVERVLRVERSALERQGVVQEFRRGGRHGPYYRLVWRRAGRQRVLYLGRAGLLVDWVRAELRTLRAPRVRELRARRQRRALRRHTRGMRRRIDQLLRDYGLHLKGHEVRGWRRHPTT